jgi:type IV pilus assembly protein PilE
MEQFYQDNRTYQSTSGFTSPCAPTGVVYTTNISGWTFSCNNFASTTYTVQANGTTGLTSGFVYDINQIGTASTTAVPANWPAIPSGNTCFITKKGMTC